MRVIRQFTVLLKNRKGTTLVELMVSFILTAILMTAAIATLSPSMRALTKVLEMSHAQTVENVVLEEIAGELESTEKIFYLENGEVQYADKNGRSVTIQVGSDSMSDEGQDLAGMLILHYNSENINWYLPEKTYMGFKIVGLTFTQVGEKNLIEMKISLMNKKSSTIYQRTKVVECYKLEKGPFPGKS